MLRRLLLGLCLPLLVLCASCGLAAQPPAPSSSSRAAGAIELTDAAGRHVTLAHQPERVVLTESRSIYATLFLHKDNPLEHIVAWGRDLSTTAPDIYAKVVERFPAAKDIPVIGSVQGNDLSVEAVMSHRPDVLVMTLDAYQAASKNGLAEKLDQAQVPVVVTDYRLDPLKNTPLSVRLLGAIFDRRAEAEEFVRYYAEQTEPIIAKAKGLGEHPSVYLWRAPGLQPCCATYGKANFGGMLTSIGADNLGTSLLPGDEGILTPEQILASQPASIIATGGEWGAMKLSDKAKTSYVRMGYAADAASARDSLSALAGQPGFDQLDAFRTRKVFAVYHQFYDSPYNFVALQAFARWTHPEQMGDVDPQRTWEQFHDRFMPYAASGTFVVGLDEARS